ncbi:MFS transporter [Ligilactobacillus hohenheimensis]|uniref:MFS transporter n=1 Tax=Ligilactobacillus hohenheimensis TaxID=2991832 RepID=UPI002DD61A82|nr:MFS transporter [Ligilactobacillus hohenheimensis]
MKHRQLPEWQHNLHVLWLNNFIIGMGFQLIMPFMALYIRQLGNFTRFQLNMWSGLVFAATFLVGISDAALLPQVQTLLTKYSPAQFSGRIFSFNQAAQFMGNIFGPMIGSTISGTFGYAGVFVSTALLILVNLGWVRRSTRPLWHRETPAVK